MDGKSVAILGAVQALEEREVALKKNLGLQISPDSTSARLTQERREVRSSSAYSHDSFLSG